MEKVVSIFEEVNEKLGRLEKQRKKLPSVSQDTSMSDSTDTESDEATEEQGLNGSTKVDRMCDKFARETNEAAMKIARRHRKDLAAKKESEESLDIEEKLTDVLNVVENGTLLDALGNDRATRLLRTTQKVLNALVAKLLPCDAEQSILK